MPCAVYQGTKMRRPCSGPARRVCGLLGTEVGPVLFRRFWLGCVVGVVGVVKVVEAVGEVGSGDQAGGGFGGFAVGFFEQG